MYNSHAWKIIGRFDNQQGAPSDISTDAPSFSVRILKKIKIWYGRQKMAVDIQKTRCGVRNRENLIKSACFI